ncbi:DUF6387 family protein [Colwellia sp. RSH04]|uniref:DUF6387 family protein n=1 Tax=Colwellia sp. RSH04 TaxID=2305464 RepID=UPI000E5749E5|nr:DUF6387 family protein [Colwellia sp. RSH04]RHW75775.1 hypothetical protein D1094_11690 [Colwellia sp. RSH04]
MENNPKKIDCVRRLKRLAKWYRPNRYAWVKDASLSKISDELSSRRVAYHELKNNSFEDGYIGDLFSITLEELPAKEPSNIECERIHEELYKSDVYPVSMGHILLCEKKYKTRSDYDADPFSQKNTMQFLADSDEDIWVNLPLYMRDSDILDEVQKLLNQLRAKLNKPQPDNYKMKSRIERLKRGGIFEYLDLDIWAKANGYLLNLSTIAQAINSHTVDTDLYSSGSEKKVYDKRTVSDDIKRQAEIAITLKFSDKLDLILANQNNEDVA